MAHKVMSLPDHATSFNTREEAEAMCKELGDGYHVEGKGMMPKTADGAPRAHAGDRPPSACNVRSINLDRLLTSDGDVAEGSKVVMIFSLWVARPRNLSLRRALAVSSSLRNPVTFVTPFRSIG